MPAVEPAPPSSPIIDTPVTSSSATSTPPAPTTTTVATTTSTTVVATTEGTSATDQTNSRSPLRLMVDRWDAAMLAMDHPDWVLWFVAGDDLAQNGGVSHQIGGQPPLFAISLSGYETQPSSIELFRYDVPGVASADDEQFSDAIRGALAATGIEIDPTEELAAELLRASQSVSIPFEHSFELDEGVFATGYAMEDAHVVVIHWELRTQ